MRENSPTSRQVPPGFEMVLLYRTSRVARAGQQGHLGRKQALQTGPAMGRWMGRPASDPGFSDRPRDRCAGPSVARRLVGWQIQRLEAGRCSGSASVSVVKATDLRLGDDSPLARWIHLAWPGGGVPIEGPVGPRAVGIREVLEARESAALSALSRRGIMNIFGLALPMHL